MDETNDTSDDIGSAERDADADPFSPSVKSSLNVSAAVELPPNPNQTKLYNSRDESGFRRFLGSGSASVSDFINEHIITVRYASIASISLLAVYGIAHTPFFFRYRTVSEIPHEYFRRRRKLPCRVVKMEPFRPNQPIFYLRHLSPVERLMFSKPSFEWMMSLQPSFKKRPDQDPSQLLKVVVAGIKIPKVEDGWMDGFVEDKTVVSCLFLARSVPVIDDTKTQWTSFDKEFSTSSLALAASTKKRPIPNLNQGFDVADNQDNPIVDPRSYGDDQIAVCKLFFRHESSLPFFKTDLATSLVQSGRAVAMEDSLYSGSSNGERLVDTSESVKDLQRDAKYLDQLARLEHEAAKGFYGIWSDHMYREQRKDVIEEVEFQSNATRLQKIWRWIRGG